MPRPTTTQRPRACATSRRRRTTKTSEDEEAEEELDDGDNKVACLPVDSDIDAYMRIAVHVHAPKVSEHGAVDFAVQASDA